MTESRKMFEVGGWKAEVLFAIFVGTFAVGAFTVVSGVVQVVKKWATEEPAQ